MPDSDSDISEEFLQQILEFIREANGLNLEDAVTAVRGKLVPPGYQLIHLGQTQRNHTR